MMDCSIRPTLSSVRFSSVFAASCSFPLSFLRLPSRIGGVPQSHNFGLILKSSTVLKQRDGNCMRVMKSQASTIASPENVLEWVKQDKRKMLHVIYHVEDLDRTINRFRFYTEYFGE